MIKQIASGSCRSLGMKVYLVLPFWGILLYIDSFRLHFSIHFIISLSISLFLPGLNNLLMAYEDKSAYALCIFSLSLGPNAEPIAFLGKTPVIFFLSHFTTSSLGELDVHSDM